MSESDRRRWDARWAEKVPLAEPAGRIVGLERWLPRQGRAVDLAGGAGRHGVWLASRGLRTTVVDVSAVALAQAARAAESAGVFLETKALDLDGGCAPGPWDVVLIHHFLDRALLRALGEQMAPGGVLVFVHPTLRNLERHDRPAQRFLLRDGEPLSLLEGWTVLASERGWGVEGRHEVVMAARWDP